MELAGNWYNDNHQENEDNNCETYVHLHVLQPHALAYTSSASSEVVSGCGKIVSSVFKVIEACSSLCEFYAIFFQGNLSSVYFLHRLRRAVTASY
jgi:hypothetical protein